MVASGTHRTKSLWQNECARRCVLARYCLRWWWKMRFQVEKCSWTLFIDGIHLIELATSQKSMFKLERIPDYSDRIPYVLCNFDTMLMAKPHAFTTANNQPLLTVQWTAFNQFDHSTAAPFTCRSNRTFSIWIVPLFTFNELWTSTDFAGFCSTHINDCCAVHADNYNAHKMKNWK